MATISDIAKKSGFSIATVSRILNYDSALKVPEATKQKVFETAEALNYTKYKSKQKNKKKSVPQKNIALFQWRQDSAEIDDIYYMSIRIGVERAAHQFGFNLIKGEFDSPELKNTIGSICIGKFDSSTIEKILQVNDNAVFIGTTFPQRGFDTINSDYAQATELAINHLLELGHRKIALVGAEEHDNMFSYREYKTPVVNTYRDMMIHHGLFNGDYFLVDRNSPLSVACGSELIQKALKMWDHHLPTAILAANDAMAIGVINELKKHNLNVPEDISVIGINDLSFSQYTSPSLTTVKTFTEEMGEVGMLTLKKRIEYPSITERIILSTELVVRESTAPVNLRK